MVAVGGRRDAGLHCSPLQPCADLDRCRLFNKYVPLGDEHKELAERLLAPRRTRQHESTRRVQIRHVQADEIRQRRVDRASATRAASCWEIRSSTSFLRDEIETVLAHELGHHVHRDIPLLITLGTLSTTVGLFLASLGLNWAIGYFGFTGVADVAAFPALMLILGAYGLVTMPLDNAVSRWRENMADDYALQATGKGEAFASAFTRLANQNLGEVDPEKWVVFLFYSHPPLGERIAKARNWKAS